MFPVLIDGKDKITHHLFRREKNRSIIGREKGICDIVIDNPVVSRQHVTISRKSSLTGKILGLLYLNNSEYTYTIADGGK